MLAAFLAAEAMEQLSEITDDNVGTLSYLLQYELRHFLLEKLDSSGFELPFLAYKDLD